MDDCVFHSSVEKFYSKTMMPKAAQNMTEKKEIWTKDRELEF